MPLRIKCRGAELCPGLWYFTGHPIADLTPSGHETMFKQSLKATAQWRHRLAATEASQGTRTRIVEAALEALKEDGFAGASARSIARRGNFNQALIFYHFGSVDDLLLAALDETSERRILAYEESLAEASTIEELVQVALRLYREDLASGHITVLSEMIAGSLSHPRLRRAVVDRMEPWIQFAERALGKAVNGSFLSSLVPTRDLAYAVVALYLGIDLLTHLDPERAGAEPLFAAANQIVPILGLLQGTT
jgi:AcrR family transcriptional regulator